MTNNTSRATGTKVQLLDMAKVLTLWQTAADSTSDPSFLASGLITNVSGEVRTINSEGVQGIIREGTLPVYTWAGYLEFTPAELKTALSGEEVDLADYIRTFGDRLERNFYYARTWSLS